MHPTAGNDAWDGLSATAGAPPQGPKRTLQAAVDVALTGDTIRLATGTYAERVTIDAKQLAFQSDAAVTIRHVRYLNGALPALRRSESWTTVNINGGFATAANWTFNTNWSYDAANTRAVRTANTSVTTLNSNIALVAGRLYRLTHSQTRTSFFGGFLPSVGGTTGTQRTSTGTFTEELVAGSSQGVAFTPVNGVTAVAGTISNVILEQQLINLSPITLDSITLSSGTDDQIGLALQIVRNAGVVRLLPGTYNQASQIALGRPVTLVGLDTLMPDGASRVILRATTNLNNLVISSNQVTVKGLTIEVRSNGSNKATNVTTNNELSGILVSGGHTNVRIRNNHIRCINPTNVNNGIGIKATAAGNNLFIHANYITSADTVTPAAGGTFSKGIWCEVGGGQVTSNTLYFNVIQDIILRFSSGTYTLRANRTTGGGVELNTLNQPFTVRGCLFRQPPGFPSVEAGGVLLKGAFSASAVGIVDSNLFTGYTAPALQIYGVPNLSVRLNRFIPHASTSFEHLRASTCADPTGCSLGANMSLEVTGNTFEGQASEAGTAINLLRERAANVFSSLTLGTPALPNTYASTIATWVRLDPTASRPVTNDLNMGHERHRYGLDLIDASTADLDQLLDIERRMIHRMDHPATGLIRLLDNQVVTTGLGTDTSFRRAMDQVTAGGTVYMGPRTFHSLPVIHPVTLRSSGMVTARWLEASGGGVTTLQAPLTLTHSLRLTSGVLQSEETIELTSPSPAALVGGGPGSYVTGRLTRAVTDDTYLFPMGNGGTGYQPARIRFLGRSGGMSRLTMAFVAEGPTQHPVTSTLIPFTEGLYEYMFLAQTGYFDLTPNHGSATYDLFIAGPPAPSFDSYTLVRRPSGGADWTASGAAVMPVPYNQGIDNEGFVGRTSISGFSSFTWVGGVDGPLSLRNSDRRKPVPRGGADHTQHPGRHGARLYSRSLGSQPPPSLTRAFSLTGQRVDLTAWRQLPDGVYLIREGSGSMQRVIIAP